MPERSMTFCKWPGCSELTSGGYCEEHALMHEEQIKDSNTKYSKQRGSTADRGYDSQWQKARLAYLKRHPLCEDCLEKGIIEPAEMVHHVKAVKERPDLRLDPKNFKALSNACHEKREGPSRFKKRESFQEQLERVNKKDGCP